MPRNVRNFWLDATIHGRITPLSAGPQAKDGGFTLRVYQRNQGHVTTAGYLVGRVDDGKLQLLWAGPDGSLADATPLHETER